MDVLASSPMLRRFVSRPRPFLIAAAALIIVGFPACGQLGGKAPKYKAEQVTHGDLSQYVTATGTLSAVVSVDVGSQISGKISALYADYNSPVKKGQMIAQIDPTVYDATSRQADGELASAQAEVILKRQNLERKKILTPMHAASQLDLDQARAELAQAEATVLIRRAVLDSARANVGYCRITAPVDGMVISRKVDVGQTVIAAMSTPILFTIAQDITKMHISTSVSEADIGHVKVEQPVNFTVDAFPDEIFHGHVSQVREAPTTVQNVVTYETLIDVDNGDRKLFPGMTADVAILVAERKGVLRIPNAALRFTPPEDASFENPPPKSLAHDEHLVYAIAAGGRKLQPIVIKIGITDGTGTEVLGAVPENAAVVVSVAEPEQKPGS